MSGLYLPRVTLADVRAARPAVIYYGAMTCWWSHRASDLSENEFGLPCDPRGGLLLEAHDSEKFLATAEADPAHYGGHGLKAFMAAHHANCVVSETDRRATCFAGWDEYNRLIDEHEART